jgi:hypothetical protein
MKVKELIEILQKHNPNREIIFLNDNNIYTVNPDGPIRLFARNPLNGMAIVHLKKEL